MDKDMPDNDLRKQNKALRLQEEHGNALGYRPMAVHFSQEAGETVSCKRMLRIMYYPL